MQTSKTGLQLIKKFEGWYPKPYADPIGIPTVGYGFTYYPDTKKRVTLNDKPLTLQEGEDMLKVVLKTYEKDVLSTVKSQLNQNQFDALVSFTFNLGGTNLRNSTLVKKVNKNPNDPSIRQEFLKWNKAGGKVLAGLTRRRSAEADLYFKPMPEETENVQTKTTTSDLNLREGAGTNFSVVEVLKKGSEVIVLSEENNWSQVVYCANKSKGWVSSAYLK